MMHLSVHSDDDDDDDDDDDASRARVSHNRDICMPFE